MIKIISVPTTNIKIAVTNEDEMHKVFNLINGWMDLRVDDDYYPERSKQNNWISYTKGYFKKKYFDNS